MLQVCERIVAVTGENPEVVRNKFRNWVTAGIIPAAKKSGTGRGTRRSYDSATVLKTAILMRFAQLGMTTEDFRDKFELLDSLLKPEWQEALGRGQPVYMIGRPPSAKRGGFLLTEFTDNLKDIEAFASAGVGFWVDVGMIHRELATLSSEDC